MNDKNFHVTFTGERVYPDSLENLNVNLTDIAHHLTSETRYAGSLPLDKRYSVAEHSILMAEIARLKYGDDVARAALLHDASEAYLKDLPRDLKSVLPEYKKLEIIIEDKVEKQYNTGGHREKVKELDRRILLDEVGALMPYNYALFRYCNPGLKPLHWYSILLDNNKLLNNIGKNNPFDVFGEFLKLAKELGVQDL